MMIYFRDDTLSETPKKKLSAESCINTLTFHTQNSSILAAATFTGHIYVWNIENDVDSLICKIVGHDEYISKVSWVNDIDSARSIRLASSGTDGLVKMWKFNIADNSLTIKTTYV